MRRWLQSSRRSGQARSWTELSNPEAFKAYGMILWLKSDVGITLNGSNVSAWDDQSGAGNDATQATAASQPAFADDEVTFDGSDDFLTIDTTLATSACSFFAALSVPDAPTTDNPILVTHEHGYYPNISSNGFFSCYANAAISSGIALAADEMTVVSAVERAANDIDIGVNSAVTTQTNGAGYPARGYAILGSENGFSRCAMTVKEIMFFNRALPPSVAARVRHYLAARHGVAL